MEASDVLAIERILALYGHLVDDEQWQRLDEVFAADATFDVTAVGAERYVGLDAIRAFFASVAHPPAHHTSNIVIDGMGGREARVVSKFFGPLPGGGIFSGEYRDLFVRGACGWRMRERVVVPRWPALDELVARLRG